MCINCILKAEQPACHSCMVRGVTVGWDTLPECCKGCDYINENGRCAAFGSVGWLTGDTCGLRSQGRIVKDWSKLREEMGGETDAERG